MKNGGLMTVCSVIAHGTKNQADQNMRVRHRHCHFHRRLCWSFDQDRSYLRPRKLECIRGNYHVPVVTEGMFAQHSPNLNLVFKF